MRLARSAKACSAQRKMVAELTWSRAASSTSFDTSWSAKRAGVLFWMPRIRRQPAFQEIPIIFLVIGAQR
jgi:hypothetical protein